jgi:O-antigen/teichoic acid export membrane protein
LRSLSELGFGQVVAQALNLLTLVVMARVLGAYGFGIVQTGAVLSTYALLMAEMGLLPLGTREVARLSERADIAHYGRIHLGLLVCLATLSLVVGLLVLPLLPFYSRAPAVFVLYLLCVLPQALMVDWISTGMGNIRGTGLFWIVRSLVYAVLVVAMLPRAQEWLGVGPTVAVPLFYLTGFLAADLVLWRFVHRLLGSSSLRPAWGPLPEWSRRLRSAIPIGSSMVVLRVVLNVDVLILGLFRDPETVGLYVATARLLSVLLIGSDVLGRVLLPRLSRAWVEGGREFADRLEHYAGLAGVALIPVPIAGVFLGPELAVWIYGESYAPTGLYLRLLAVAYPLMALGILLGNGLIASDRQQAYLARLGSLAVVLVAAMLVLVRSHGALGLCWSMIGAGVGLVASCGWASRDALGRRFWSILALAILPSLAMAAGIHFSADRHVSLRLLTGALLYAATLSPLLRRHRSLRR